MLSAGHPCNYRRFTPPAFRITLFIRFFSVINIVPSAQCRSIRLTEYCGIFILLINFSNARFQLYDLLYIPPEIFKEIKHIPLKFQLK